MSWFSENIGTSVGAIIGTIIAPGVGTMIGASIGSTIDKQKATKEQAGAVIGAQEQIAAEQLTAQKETAAERLQLEREIAAQQYRLTETQMRFQMGQQQVELLANLFLEQDRIEPRPATRVLTLPSTAPSGIIDQLNLWLNRALRA